MNAIKTMNAVTKVSKATVYGIETEIVESQISKELHECYQPELNKGKGGFVITTEDLDKVGERNWATITLSFPELSEENEIRVRVSLNIIKGDATKVSINGEEVNSYKANVPNPALKGSRQNEIIRLRTNYMNLKDLLAVTEFSVQEQNRIVDWCRTVINGKSSMVSMTLVPASDEAVFAFDLKLNFHPDTGALAKNTPIGINNFYMSGFGLLPNSALSTFGGSFRLKGSTKVVNTQVVNSEVEKLEAVLTEKDL